MLFLKLFSLLLYQINIIEIIYLHCFSYFIHSLSSCSTCNFATILENIENLRNILFKLMTTLTNRIKHAIDNTIQQLLALHITYSTMCVGIFKCIKIIIFRPEVCEILIC